MNLDSVVSIVVTRASATITRTSFSIPLIAAFSVPFTGIRTYNASTMLLDMVTDGFTTTSPAYLAAQAMLAQDPRPKKIKIGKLTTTWSQTISIVPTALNLGVYNGRVNDQPWTFTADSSATLAEVVTGIASAIDALSGVAAVSAGGTAVTVTADGAGSVLSVVPGAGTGVYTYSDTTTAGSIVTELTALRNLDPDWYGLVIDRTGEAVIEAVAAWAETQRIIFVPTSSDTGMLDAGVTTDVGSDLKTSAYDRTVLWYSPNYTDFLGAAVLATVLPYEPGAASWYYRSPKGVAVAVLSETQQQALEGKNVNYLTTVSGRRVTNPGQSSSGLFVDIVQASDWIRARMQEDVFAFLTSSPKIPYEDLSVQRCLGVMQGVLNLGVQRRIISADPSPFVEGPLVLDVDETTRGQRILPDLTFSCRLTGGIKSVDINGFVAV